MGAFGISRTTAMRFFNFGQLLLAIGLVIFEIVSRGFLYLFSRPLTMLFEYFGWDFSVKVTEDELDMERDTIAYIANRGFVTEEHFVHTPDGFVLGLHRIPRPAHADPDTPSKGAVIMMHGFMQSSEAWAIRRNTNDSLPLVLANNGYDVWLGNNRGNKYSFKHVQYKSNQEEFWDWSIDELVRHDLPSIINYVCETSGRPQVSLIGFSQGSAQSFACLSSNKKIAEKVNILFGMAPVSMPHGLKNPVVNALARSRPDFIFLLFGKRIMLQSAYFWRKTLSRKILVYVLDQVLNFLFGWNTQCIAQDEKAIVYSHIYSYASVKNVVHWFQMIQNNKFQMFDDDIRRSPGIFNPNDSYTGSEVHTYQPSHIMTPVALFYGGRDGLPNTTALLASLPKSKLVHVHKEPLYEHMDFMYAKDVHEKIHPSVLLLLDQYNALNNVKTSTFSKTEK